MQLSDYASFCQLAYRATPDQGEREYGEWVAPYLRSMGAELVEFLDRGLTQGYVVRIPGEGGRVRRGCLAPRQILGNHAELDPDSQYRTAFSLIEAIMRPGARSAHLDRQRLGEGKGVGLGGGRTIKKKNNRYPAPTNALT